MKAIAISLLAVASVFTGAARAEKTDLKLVAQQGDHYFFSVSRPWASDLTYVEGVAKNFCAGKTFCFAYVWDAKDGAAKKLPLTDRQLEQMLVSYRMNKNTGLGKLSINCKKFKDAPKEQCM